MSCVGPGTSGDIASPPHVQPWDCLPSVAAPLRRQVVGHRSIVVRRLATRGARGYFIQTGVNVSSTQWLVCQRGFTLVELLVVVLIIGIA